MNRSRNRSRLILLAVALVTAGAMLAWQFLWVKPRQDCERHGGVWSEQYNGCAHTVTITTEIAPAAPQKQP